MISVLEKVKCVINILISNMQTLVVSMAVCYEYGTIAKSFLTEFTSASFPHNLPDLCRTACLIWRKNRTK